MKKQPSILIIGTGGHARVVAALIQSGRQFRIQGFLDLAAPNLREKILGIPVVGSLQEARRWRQRGVTHAAIAIGDNRQRSQVYRQLTKLGFSIPALIHPKAYVDSTATIGPGVQVSTGAVIGPCAIVREGSIVNTGSIIDHETVLDAFTHVAPGCAIAGRVTIGEGTFVGIGTSVIDHIEIGSWAIVGAGSVVISNIANRTTAYGVPAKVRNKR